ncbi:hypothetical protein XM57_16680 [Burkholderia cepacia]|nr:hypothetical protein XM57_16680 [Burkholderia cepacia]ETP66896.1 hypothetical protein BDSB_13260 [Burkholderia dolosa PC543]
MAVSLDAAQGGTDFADQLPGSRTISVKRRPYLLQLLHHMSCRLLQFLMEGRPRREHVLTEQVVDLLQLVQVGCQRVLNFLTDLLLQFCDQIPSRPERDWPDARFQKPVCGLRQRAQQRLHALPDAGMRRVRRLDRAAVARARGVRGRTFCRCRVMDGSASFRR